jgi:hypothetical protein
LATQSDVRALSPIEGEVDVFLLQGLGRAISANGPASIGEMIANAMEKVGDNGLIKPTAAR